MERYMNETLMLRTAREVGVMSKLSKQQATNALERIKSALRADNQDKAVELVQQIFEAGFQHGINSIFESTPNKE